MCWLHKTRNLRWQLGLSYAALTLVATALLTGLALGISSSMALTAELEQASRAIKGAAMAFSEALAEPTANLSQIARQQSLATDGRILWLNADGSVRLDAFGDAQLGGAVLTLPSELSEADRPVAHAYDSPNGWAIYAVAPIADKPHAGPQLLLLAKDISHTEQNLVRLRTRLWVLGGLLAGGFAILGQYFAHSLSHPLEELTLAAKKMQAGQLEQQVLASGSLELCQLASAFNAMAASIASLDESRRDFVANAAHELRTPLAALQALAYEMPLADSSIFIRQTERLGRTVDNLLTLAKLDNPATALQPLPIRTRNLLMEVFWMLRPLAEKHALRILPPVANDTEPWVLGDPDWLHLALINILDNSIRYTPPRGWIEASISTATKLVTITIKDSGPGVPEQVLSQLGHRFFRVSAAREHQGGGSGLGLAIVREIIEMHGGHLNFASPPGQGLQVTITLPSVSPPEDEM